MSSADLPSRTYEQIDELIQRAAASLEERQFDTSLSQLFSALRLIPEPQHGWEVYPYIFADIGNVYYHQGEYRLAENAFQEAMKAGWHGHPFVNLRLGEIAFNIGDFGKAIEWFTGAYMVAGRDAFNHEPNHFWEFVKSKIEVAEEDRNWTPEA